MKGKIHAGVIGLLIAAIGAFGVVETLQAAPPNDRGPKESQRLRGMEGRVFFLDNFFVLPDGTLIPNDEDYCYHFNSNGEWVDELFPVPGVWEQHSVGAATGYTVTAAADLGFGLIELFQDGQVTPARGKGVLQLEALTDVYLGGDPWFVLLVVGEEIDECPAPAD